MRSITQNTCLALVPSLVWSVDVQPPGHAVDGVPKQISAVGVQLFVVLLQNFFYWDLLELEPFLVVFGQL